MAGSGPVVFSVWAYVIAHTVKGQVELNPLILSAVIGAPIQDIEKAIEYLCAPDPKSRNRDRDGARLVREGQYAFLVVSHFIYREMVNEDERREYNRRKQAEHRAKNGKSPQRRPESMTVNDMSKQSMTVNDSSAMSRQAEAEAEAEASQMNESARARESIDESWMPAPKRPVVNPTPAQEAEKTRNYGCRWPTESDVSLYCGTSGIDTKFAENWLADMAQYCVEAGDGSEKRMLDSGGRPVMNWKTYLLGFWRRRRTETASGQRTGNQNRSTGRPERIEDPLEGCRDAVKVPDAIPHWDADKELPTDEWVHFKGCFQATITDRELYRRLYRAKQSRGEDTTEIFKELMDECRREWKGAFDKYWTQFISRKI